MHASNLPWISFLSETPHELNLRLNWNWIELELKNHFNCITQIYNPTSNENELQLQICVGNWFEYEWSTENVIQTFLSIQIQFILSEVQIREQWEKCGI